MDWCLSVNHDRPAVIASVGDGDADGAGNMADHALGPFDGDDAGRGQVLIEANLVEIGAIEPVQIDVDER